MKPVGEVFRLKATYREIREELIPRFDAVVRSWMGEPVPTRFRDPDYVYSSTYLTEPLKMFVRGITEALTIGQPTGGPLEKSFGFGKTHAMILLWHLFSSDLALRHAEFAKLGLTDSVVRSTLVLGLDFREEKPFSRLIQELKVYTDPTHPVSRLKDPALLRAASSVLTKRRLGAELMSYEVAELIANVLTEYRELGGEPRLLLMVDELGFGVSLKLKTYCEEFKKGRAGYEELYTEITRFMDFLSHLYARLEKAAIPSVVVWAIADQDRRNIEGLRDRYFEDEHLRRRIDSVLSELSILAERYRRGTGGASIAAFSYSARHAIEIAKFRVLKALDGVDTRAAAKEFLEDLGALAGQINIAREFEARKGVLEAFYPFSPGLLSLMTKLMRAEDVPNTEFVRTVLHTVARAAENALTLDPMGCPTIGVKHLKLSDIARVELLKELAPTWLGFLTDVEHAVERAPAEVKDVIQHISKLVAAKGVTAILPALFEARDRGVVSKYGVSLDELQLDILASYRASRALEMVEKVMDGLNYLKAESGRIDEREVDGAKYYLPTIVRTPLARLASLIVEERSKIKDLGRVPFYIGQSLIPSLFSQLRIMIGKYQVTVLMKRFDEVMGDIGSDREVMEAQRSGQLAVVIVPPWDLSLFEKIYRERADYGGLITQIESKLNALVKANKLPNPLHIVIMVPNISEARLKPLLRDELAVYQATKRFIDHLAKHERIVEEMIGKLIDVVQEVSKRLAATLPEYARLGKIQRRLKEVVTKQLSDARNIAQRSIIALSRRLVADTVSLYEKAVYFSVDKGSFDAMSTITVHRRAEERIRGCEYPELNRYAPIVNRFIEDVVKTIGFSVNTSNITSKLRDAYRREFKEEGVVRGFDRIEDVVENIMAGVYGIRPLNKDVARDAVSLLEGTTIDLEDKIVKITVDSQQGLIVFRTEVKVPKVKPKEPTEAVTPYGRPTPVVKPVVKKMSLRLPTELDTQDLTSRLSEVITSFQGKVGSIVVQVKEARGVRLSATAEVKDASQEDRQAIGSLISLFKYLSDMYGARLAVTLEFKEEVEFDKVKAILGEYVPRRITTFGDWLP